MRTWWSDYSCVHVRSTYTPAYSHDWRDLRQLLDIIAHMMIHTQPQTATTTASVHQTAGILRSNSNAIYALFWHERYPSPFVRGRFNVHRRGHVNALRRCKAISARQVTCRCRYCDALLVICQSSTIYSKSTSFFISNSLKTVVAGNSWGVNKNAVLRSLIRSVIDYTSCAGGRHNMPPPPASWPLTFWPWKWYLSHVWRGLPLCHF